ncbi:phosphoribosylamine--glycine ligase [Ichthyobacterium seriolicida]|nr:hypothetical protein [Ichthyobacterium seriolicida]
MKNKFLVVGNGARESAFAINLSSDSIVYAVIQHKNPTIVECVQNTHGKYLVADVNDPDVVLNFARDNEIDYVFVSSDQPLANGVVDVLLENNIRAIGGTKEATRIEWDKIYSIDLVKKVCGECVPFYLVVSNDKELVDAVEEFKKRRLDIVVKPQGLTGGKGVKLMPNHLKKYEDCIDYSRILLKNNPTERVLLVEKLDGIEFTIMGFTDGENLVLSPASYDYPYRHENDLGDGTGGMGCFTNSELKLPFMSDSDLDQCKEIMKKTLSEMRERNLNFNGILNGGFFKTKDGIKFMEYNGRFGDPEAMNVLSVLNEPLSTVLENIWHKKISEDNITFVGKASVVKYLVAKEYPQKSESETLFSIKKEEMSKFGISIFCSFCEELGNRGAYTEYKTLKTSRVIAFGCISEDIESASDLINEAIEKYVMRQGLEFRRDIGSRENLILLSEKASKY